MCKSVVGVIFVYVSTKEEGQRVEEEQLTDQGVVLTT